MIEVEKAERWRHCNCCHSSDDVHEINFRSDGQGITVALCADCIKELQAVLRRSDPNG